MIRNILLVMFFILGLTLLSRSLELSVPQQKIVAVATSTTPLATTSASIVAKAKVATTTQSIKTIAKKIPARRASQGDAGGEKPKIVAPVIQTPPEPPPDFEAINTFARMAIINILCETSGITLSPIVGTGVVISPQGVIITNAHIGQYWLLQNFYKKDSVNCVIRTGSPAYPRYHAELLYISPTWIASNKDLLKETNPKGTGENDFALLRIVGRVDKTNLGSSFSYITPNTREIVDKGEPVLLVSYPAGFLGGLSILQDLNITSSITTIQDFYTFKENTIDLLSVGGTVVSQKGASGGAVVDKHSTIIGVITTTSEGTTTSQRDLNAITIAHVSRTLVSEIGITLPQLLSSDIVSFAKSFQINVAPTLTKIITNGLNMR